MPTKWEQLVEICRNNPDKSMQEIVELYPEFFFVSNEHPGYWDFNEEVRFDIFFRSKDKYGDLPEQLREAWLNAIMTPVYQKEAMFIGRFLDALGLKPERVNTPWSELFSDAMKSLECENILSKYGKHHFFPALIGDSKRGEPGRNRNPIYDESYRRMVQNDWTPKQAFDWLIEETCKRNKITDPRGKAEAIAYTLELDIDNYDLANPKSIRDIESDAFSKFKQAMKYRKKPK